MMFDASTTHIIHEGRAERNSTMTLAKKQRLPIVHREWLVSHAACALVCWLTSCAV